MEIKNPDKVILIMMWILIGILLLVNFVVVWRIHDFRDKCAIDYDLDDGCPCDPPKGVTFNPLNNINITITTNYTDSTT